MKKSFIHLAIVTSIATACSGSNLIPNPEVGTGMGNVKNGVTATFQQPIMEGDEVTKALNSNLEFTFEQDAQINVYPSTSRECMTYALTPADGASAEFVVENFNLKDGTYGAVYPADKPVVDPTQVKFSLAGQNQVANDDASHLTAYDLNYAQADVTGNTGVFNFAHQVAWLKVIVPVEDDITFDKLTISANEGVSNTITLNTVTGVLTSTPTSSSETIVIRLNGDSGISVSAGSTLTVYATIPAGNYTGLSFSCGPYAKTIIGSKVREAGHAYQIALEKLYQVVDLGLPSGLLWSKDNLGVETARYYGLHYAWGYTTGFYYNGGQWTDGTNNQIFSLNYISVVKQTDLSDAEDAAVQTLGNKYRMPTKEDFEELIEQTNQEWINENGVSGVYFSSKQNSDNKIFIPACGFARGNSWDEINSQGIYRTRTYKSNMDWADSYCLYFNVNNPESLSVTDRVDRPHRYYYGFSIRPVYDPSL